MSLPLSTLNGSLNPRDVVDPSASIQVPQSHPSPNLQRREHNPHTHVKRVKESDPSQEHRVSDLSAPLLQPSDRGFTNRRPLSKFVGVLHVPESSPSSKGKFSADHLRHLLELISLKRTFENEPVAEMICEATDYEITSEDLSVTGIGADQQSIKWPLDHSTICYVRDNLIRVIIGDRIKAIYRIVLPHPVPPKLTVQASSMQLPQFIDIVEIKSCEITHDRLTVIGIQPFNTTTTLTRGEHYTDFMLSYDLIRVFQGDQEVAIYKLVPSQPTPQNPEGNS